MRNTSEKTAIKLHIFDMDGTLLDSMRMWDNISSDYLRTKGIEPPENLASILDPMTFPEVCSYLAVNWNLGSPETVSREIARFLDHQYEEVLFPTPWILSGRLKKISVSASSFPTAALTRW